MSQKVTNHSDLEEMNSSEGSNELNSNDILTSSNDVSYKSSMQVVDDDRNICGTIERHPETEQKQLEIDSYKSEIDSINKEKSKPILDKNSQFDLIYSEIDLQSDALLPENNFYNEIANGHGVNSSHKPSSNAGELVISWNGTEVTKVKQRRNRSQSWCANRPNDDGFGVSEIRLLRDRLVRTQHRVQPAIIKTFSNSQRLTLASLALVDFMSFCSMSIMAPFFPKESAKKGMSDTVAGFVFSFYALVMFLSSPIFGKVLPRLGAKFLFIAGMFIAGICNILFGTLEYLTDYTLFTVYCFLIRGLEALGASAFSTASYVFVVNHFPNNIGSVFGILETFVGLGMSVGPAIGGLLYSFGGFGLPFYVLGVAMVVTIPLNCCLLASDGEFTMGSKSGSILQLFKVPSVVITGLVIVVVSNTWAFLDPTLEPHLRQFDLSPEQIGLIFLLFSGLYGLFSPIWGWLADRVSSHWCMMFWGLIFCTLGLLLLGPTPLIPILENSVWLNLVALSILGMSVALTLLPTFQGVLTSSIEEGGCAAVLSTYSVVAGVWSCCYSLGEVIGPALGGALTERAGFPLTTTIMAALCFFMALITLTFFTLKENGKLGNVSDTMSDMNSGSDYFKSASLNGNGSRITIDDDNASVDERRPLLSDKDIKKPMSYEIFAREVAEKLQTKSKRDSRSFFGDGDNNDNDDPTKIPGRNNYHVENVSLHTEIEANYKKGKTGIYPVVNGNPEYSLIHSKSENNTRRNSLEVIKYNFNKIKYYEKIRKEEIDVLNFDKNQLTDVMGTINLTPSGACEV